MMKVTKQCQQKWPPLAYCHRFIIHDPIIHILSVYMLFQIILCKVMPVLQRSWDLQGGKWHTFGFQMQGFLTLGCTPPCLVLKERKRMADISL